MSALRSIATGGRCRRRRTAPERRPLIGPDLTLVAAAVALLSVGAARSPLPYRVLGERTGYAGAVVAAASFGLPATEANDYGTVEASWVPALNVGVQFTVDGWDSSSRC